MNPRLNTPWIALRFGIGLMATLAGLDKFFNLLADWGAYVSPLAAQVLPFSTDSFMAIVGVILFAPAFSALWVGLARRSLNPAAPLKFAFGLLLMGLGFLFMVKAAGIAAGGMKSPVYWLVLTYLVHTFGELCLSPVGLSTVTKLAPARFVGQMMGVWFLASSLGKLTAGLIAGTFDPNDVAAMPGQYLNIVIYGCSVGLLLLLISRPVTRLMGGVR